MAAAQDTRAAVVIDQEVLTDAYAEPGEAARAGPGVSAGTRSRHEKGARMLLSASQSRSRAEAESPFTPRSDQREIGQGMCCCARSGHGYDVSGWAEVG